MKRRTVSGKTLIEMVVIMAIVTILGALVLGGRGGCLVGCNEDYSEGARTGIVTKLSRKGFAKKTWEGEMNLGGFSSDIKGNMHANLWQFTVREEDEESLKKVEEALRSQRPVTIRYKEWMIRPGCQTDSGYMVESVEFVKTDSKEGDKR